MASCQPRYVTSARPAELMFSVCTLVASDRKYRRMLASFAQHGFDDTNSEFIALDNRGENRFEGYGALRRVFPELRGEYILFTHDDIELIEDGAERLRDILRDLDARDPRWAVAGNAGHRRARPETLLRHLADPHGEERDCADAPVRVQGLDENFLVLRRANMVFPSMDLEGFHLFATDLCLQAMMAGGHAYVIPFYLRHHSGGSASPELDRAIDRMGEKYAALQRPARIRSPASTIYVGARGDMLRWRDRGVAGVTRRMKRVTERLFGP